MARSSIRVSIVASTLGLLTTLSLLACQSQAPASPTAAPAPKATTAAPAAAPTTAAAPVATTAPTQAPAAAAPAETLKIGIETYMTGRGARTGANIDRFVRMGIDDINAKGGFKVGNKTYKIEAVTVDDKGTSEGGREAANRLVLAEKVKYILGTVSSPLAGAQAITEPNKVVLLACTANDKSLSAPFKYTLNIGVSHASMRSNAIFEWLANEHPEVKRISLVMSDDTTGHSIGDAMEADAKKRGITVIGREYFPTDLKDFSPILTRVLAQNPDGIATAAGGYAPLFTQMMKVLSEKGYKGQVFGTSANSTTMSEVAAYANNFTGALMADWDTPVVGDKEKELIRRAIAMVGESEVDAFTVSNYAIPVLMADVMAKAGTIDDVDAFMKVAREGEWDTIWSQRHGKSKFVGARVFGTNSVFEQPVYLGQVSGGKVATIAGIKGTID